jgi:hypothetical protein
MLSNKKLDDAFPGVMEKVKTWERRCPFCGSTDVEEAEGWDYTSWREKRWVVKAEPPPPFPTWANLE